MEIFQRILTKEGINRRFVEAVNAVIKNETISKTALAESMNVKPAKFSEILNGRMKAGADMIAILCDYYNISPDWILMSRGRMFRDSDLKPIVINEGSNKTDITIDAKAIPLAVAKQQNLQPIPLVTQNVAAGFGNENFSIAESDVKEYYVIPKFRYCQVDFMIEVSGDSMTPHLNSGDVIACTIIRDSHFIQWSRIHVIATREQGLLVKRLAPSSDDSCLQAVSDNPKYPPFSIPKDEITGIALVVGSVCLE